MSHRRGFTLIEMLVAIVIAGGVVATARALVEAIGDAGVRLAAAAKAEDTAVGGELLARSIIRQARVRPDDPVSLFGTDRAFVVRSWCPVAGGWSEPCDVPFAIDDSTATLVMRPGSGAAAIVAARGRESITLRYLASAPDGGRWLERWTNNELPLAIGIVIDGDTLIVPAGR